MTTFPTICRFCGVPLANAEEAAKHLTVSLKCTTELILLLANMPSESPFVGPKPTQEGSVTNQTKQ